MRDTSSTTRVFLFTDIESSTRLWQANPDLMGISLKRHDQIMTEAIRAHRGRVFKTVGDAFCAVFETATDAVNSAIDAQLRLHKEPWDSRTPIKVRMAIHAGQADLRDGDYFGPTLNRTARLLSAGHGGQTLVSLVVAELILDRMSESLQLTTLGNRRLKDLIRPETVFQVNHPDLPLRFPELKTLDTRPNNLPVQPTPLIGRELQIQELAEAVFEAEEHLVTVTGPGGIGKTRLSLQFAADHIERFTDGAFFVNLAPLDDAGLVVPVIARTLNLTEPRDTTFFDALVEHIRHKSMLLVLDNLEQIMEARGHVVALLQQCPELRVVVTSREPLKVRGEKVVTIPPLAVPERGSYQEAIPTLTQFDSVRLFLERASAVSDSFTVTLDNAPAIAEICVKLDGIPLAIELAASRISMLTPQEILERLGKRLRVLTGGSNDLPPRHRTLEAALEWSHSLLEPRLQKLFALLSVFTESFSLEAVEDVARRTAERDGRLTENVDVIVDDLSSLIDRNLVVRFPAPPHQSRFRMLDTVREFSAGVAEKESIQSSTKDAHARYFAELAETWCPRIDSVEAAMALGTLDQDYLNIYAALSHAVSTGDTDLAVSIGSAMWTYWQYRGDLTGGVERLEAVQRLAQESTHPGEATIRAGLAELEEDRGQFAHALRHLARARVLFSDQDDLCGQAWAELVQAGVLMSQADSVGARESFSRAKKLADQCEDRVLAARALMGAAILAQRAKKLDRALKIFQVVDRTFKAHGKPRLRSMALSNLAQVYDLLGDTETALSYASSALDLARRLGDLWMQCIALANVADLSRRQGQVTRALELHQEMRALAARLGSDIMIAEADIGIGESQVAAGNFQSAYDTATAAHQRAKNLGLALQAGHALRVVGMALSRSGQSGSAAKALQEAGRTLTEAGDDRAAKQVAQLLQGLPSQ